MCLDLAQGRNFNIVTMDKLCSGLGQFDKNGRLFAVQILDRLLSVIATTPAKIKL